MQKSLKLVEISLMFSHSILNYKKFIGKIMLKPKIKSKCLVCNGNNLNIIMSIADQPLSRYGLVKTKDCIVKRFPIEIARCGSCTHMQNIAFLENSVDYTNQEVKESRVYSERMKIFMESQAAFLKSLHKKELFFSQALEIGCGDGYFISQFDDFARIVGFEPSPEGEMARKRGVFLIDTYFSVDRLEEFVGFDIVIMRQVLEHIGNPRALIREIKKKILKDGLLYLEVPNGAKSYNKSRFHDFYYEHVSYFTKSSLTLLLENENFEVLSCKSDYEEEIITFVARHRGDEVADEFTRLTEKMKAVQAQVQSWLKERKKIVGWGTAGNGSLFFSLLGITDQEIEYVVDSDARKQGLFLPITKQKVISPNALVQIDPDVVIVLSQFHADEITVQARNLIGDKIIVNFFD